MKTASSAARLEKKFVLMKCDKIIAEWNRLLLAGSLEFCWKVLDGDSVLQSSQQERLSSQFHFVYRPDSFVLGRFILKWTIFSSCDPSRHCSLAADER